jgi:4-hydroxy-tetrahydrodipicolinate synthase
MCDAALAGNAQLAAEIDEPLRGLYSSLFCEANPIPVKWAVHRMGLITHGHIRLPLTELSEQFHGLLLESMKKAQIKVQ